MPPNVYLVTILIAFPFEPPSPGSSCNEALLWLGIHFKALCLAWIYYLIIIL